MAIQWKKATAGLSADAWDFEKEKTCEGLFVRVQTNVGPNSSNMYYFENKGKEFSVWGSTFLDRVMSGIPIGEVVQITYLGKAKSPKTGREYKNYEVLHGEPEVPSKETTVTPEIKEKELDELFNGKK